MNLCMMSILRVICSVSRCFKRKDPMLWLPYLRDFGQFLLNPVPLMMVGWSCRCILSIIWSVYDLDERMWVRILFTILWKEVWI